MTEFDDGFHRKERAEEANWRLKQEKAFEIAAKRDKLFGLWAAGQLGLAETAGYVRCLMDVGVAQGDRAMLDKVAADFAAAGLAAEDGALTVRLNDCERQAQALVGTAMRP